MMTKLRKPIALAIGCVVLLLVLGLGYVLTRHQGGHPSAPASTATPPPAVVEITASGFLPQTVSIPAGAQVIWVNEDVMPHTPAADPYPTHASLPGLLSPRALGQKETYSFTFTKPGTVHYHDDLHPGLTGTIEVR